MATVVDFKNFHLTAFFSELLVSEMLKPTQIWPFFGFSVSITKKDELPIIKIDTRKSQ